MKEDEGGTAVKSNSVKEYEKWHDYGRGPFVSAGAH